MPFVKHICWQGINVTQRAVNCFWDHSKGCQSICICLVWNIRAFHAPLNSLGELNFFQKIISTWLLPFTSPLLNHSNPGKKYYSKFNKNLITPKKTDLLLVAMFHYIKLLVMLDDVEIIIHLLTAARMAICFPWGNNFASFNWEWAGESVGHEVCQNCMTLLYYYVRVS